MCGRWDALPDDRGRAVEGAALELRTLRTDGYVCVGLEGVAPAAGDDVQPRCRNENAAKVKKWFGK